MKRKTSRGTLLPVQKLDTYGNVFLSMESAEEEQSEDMIKEPPDKKPLINRPKAPPRRTKHKGKDGQNGSEELIDWLNAE